MTKPSPNIWEHPDVYEIENEAVDPDGILESAMLAIADWTGADVLDIGCGAGFHLPRFGTRARCVIGVEPHLPLVERARARIAALTPATGSAAGSLSASASGSGWGRITVLPGLAEALPLPDSSVDVGHARWAYFFGPGCQPGLAELERVMRPGGTAFVIDNDATRSRFGDWFRRQWPAYDPAGIERFWRRQGWTREPLTIRWEMASRADFEAVVRIEFDPGLAERLLAEHAGARVDYAVNLWHREF